MEELIPGMNSKSDLLSNPAKATTLGSELDHLFRYFAVSPVAIQIIQFPDLQYSYVNPAACEMMGRSSEDFIGQPISSFISQEKLPELQQMLDTVRTEKKSYTLSEIPSTFERKGQSYSGFFNIVYQPLLIKDNEVSGVIVNTTDVTSYVYQRSSLSDTEAQLRSALQCAQLGTWDYNPISGTLKVDERFRSITGLADHVTPDLQSLLSQVVAADRMMVQSAIEAVISRSLPEYEQEFRIINARSQEVSMLRVRGNTVFDSQGRLTRFFGSILKLNYLPNSTSLQQDEEFLDQLSTIQTDLAHSRSLIRTVLDNSNELIGLYDRDTRALYFNKKSKEIFNLREEDFIGKTFKEIFPDAINSSTHQLLLRAIAGEMIVGELHASAVSARHYETSLVPLKNGKGHVFAVLAMAYDVSRCHDALSKLESINLSLKLVNQELEQYATVASHDLQEPLRKIQTFSNLLLESNRLNIDKKGLDYITRISSAAKRMSGLVKGLLEYSRTTRDQTQFTSVDLNEIISGIVLDVELAIAQKNALVECSGLPTIQAIPLQMQRLFYNLISNGLKFTKQEKPRIEITCGSITLEERTRFQLNPSREYVQIVVKDNGIGFAQKDAERIFEMFHRLDSVTYSGTGIGLAVCKKIVENHQGIIYADAGINSGAAFHIILPVLQKFS